jgi:DNA-binding LytR/AlgR family response regulator
MSSKRILIIEDEVIIAENIRRTLLELEYDVAMPCLSMQQAIDILNTEIFDLVLLDINLGKGDEGIHLGKYIRMKYSIPFIFLTANSDKDTIQAAIDTKPAGYLIKPTNSNSLYAAIETALKNKISPTASDKKYERKFNTFLIKNGKKYKAVLWDDVIAIAANRNYVNFHYIHETKTLFRYTTRSTLTNAIQVILPKAHQDAFVQINRSQFVRISAIKSIQSFKVETRFETFTMSEAYYSKILKAFLLHSQA